MKKILILFILSLFINSCFIGKNEVKENNYENKNLVKTIENTSNGNKKNNIKNSEEKNLEEECEKVVKGEKSKYLEKYEFYSNYINVLEFLNNKDKILFWKEFVKKVKEGGKIFLKNELKNIDNNKLGYIAINDFLNGTNKCLISRDPDKCIEITKIINYVLLNKIDKTYLNNISYYKFIIIYNNFDLNKFKKEIDNIFLKQCYNLK